MYKYAEKSNVIRERFSEKLDEVVRFRPKLITRRRDRIFAFSLEQISSLLDHVRLHVFISKDEDGQYIATLPEIEDIYSTGETVDETLDSMAQELMYYAEDYYERFDIYSRAPNRKIHFPIIMKILLQEDHASVKGLLHAEFK